MGVNHPGGFGDKHPLERSHLLSEHDETGLVGCAIFSSL